MRWFEHRTDAANNKKIKKIKLFYREQGGQAVMAAMGRFWGLLEIVGQQGLNEEGADCFTLPEDYGLEVLADDLCCTLDELREFLDLLAQIYGIEAESWQNQQKIYIPKLAKRADNYTKRIHKTRTDNKESSNTVRTVFEDSSRKLSPQTQTQTQTQKRKKPTPLPPKTKTPLPEDFMISDGVRAWALKKGYGRLEDHLEAFVTRCLAKDYRNVDWDAAFKTAIREDWGKIRAGCGVPAVRGSPGARPPSKAEAVTQANLAARKEALQ